MQTSLASLQHLSWLWHYYRKFWQNWHLQPSKKKKKKTYRAWHTCPEIFLQLKKYFCLLMRQGKNSFIYSFSKPAISCAGSWGVEEPSYCRKKAGNTLNSSPLHSHRRTSQKEQFNQQSNTVVVVWRSGAACSFQILHSLPWLFNTGTVYEIDTIPGNSEAERNSVAKILYTLKCLSNQLKSLDTVAEKSCFALLRYTLH